MVTGYEGLIGQLTFPDPDDRHVLAAAIRSHAGVIVTYNTKDLPLSELRPYGIEAQHPDEFVTHLLDLSPGTVYSAVRNQRQMLKNPPRSVRQFLDTLLLLGLASTVAALEPMHELL
jgi:hypothetical protein